MSGAGVVRRTVVAALLLAGAQLAPLRAAHAQRRDDARMAFAPARPVHAALVRAVPVAASPNHTAGLVLGAVIGGAVGGVLGYHMVKSSCVSCDENGPLFLGGTIGALGGAAVGLMLVRWRTERR